MSVTLVGASSWCAQEVAPDKDSLKLTDPKSQNFAMDTLPVWPIFAHIAATFQGDVAQAKIGLSQTTFGNTRRTAATPTQLYYIHSFLLLRESGRLRMRQAQSFTIFRLFAPVVIPIPGLPQIPNT